MKVQPGFTTVGHHEPAGESRKLPDVVYQPVRCGIGVFGEFQEEFQHGLDGVLSQFWHGGMSSLATGTQQHLQIAIMPQAWHHVGGFADHRPGDAVFSDQRLGAITLLLLADHQGKAHRRQGLLRLGQHAECLDHGCAASLHIRDAQPEEGISFLMEAKVLQVKGGDRVQVSHKAEINSI